MYKRVVSNWVPLVLVVAITACGGGSSSSGGAAVAPQPPPPVFGVGPADCVGGTADGFACLGMRLRKHVTLASMGGTRGSDIWGWTDSQDGKEYALMGLSDAVSFVDISDPEQPVVIGSMATATIASSWRDIKVFADHAFVVADAVGAHGMQVFDLTRLRGAGTGGVFTPDIIYSDFASAHNIVINESSGFAYIVGTDTCAGGLHMVDISTPLNPMFAGCHDADGDTHDAQCVTYAGPDTDHLGSEICIDSNEDHVAIVDVSTKSSPVTLATFTYPNLGFVHQNWLTEDHTFLFVGDELDETNSATNTRTLGFDVSDLDSPQLVFEHVANTTSIDHNLYVVGNRLYQANYAAGLRVLTFGNLSSDTLVEEAFFDTRPEDNNAEFNGAWGVYPFFSSGVIVISDINRGLFIVSP